MAEITRKKLTEALMLCTREIATCSAKTVTAKAAADKQKYQQNYEGYKLLAELCKMALKGSVQTALTSSAAEAAAMLAGLYGRRCRVVRNDYHFDGDRDKDYYIIGCSFAALHYDGLTPADVAEEADIMIMLSIAREDQDNIKSCWTVRLNDVKLVDEGAEDGRR